MREADVVFPSSLMTLQFKAPFDLLVVHSLQVDDLAKEQKILNNYNFFVIKHKLCDSSVAITFIFFSFNPALAVSLAEEGAFEAAGRKSYKPVLPLHYGIKLRVPLGSCLAPHPKCCISICSFSSIQYSNGTLFKELNMGFSPCKPCTL